MNTLIDIVMEEEQVNLLQKMEDRILAELAKIKRYTLLGAKRVLTIEDVSFLTGLSVGHLYKLTCRRGIPFYKPHDKQIYFDKKEIEDWLLQKRVATKKELENQAITYLTTGRK